MRCVNCVAFAFLLYPAALRLGPSYGGAKWAGSHSADKGLWGLLRCRRGGMVVDARCVVVCLMISFGHRSGGREYWFNFSLGDVVHLHYLRY